MQVGDIWVELGVDKDQFTKAMQSAEKQAISSAQRIEGAFGSVKRVLGSLAIGTSFSIALGLAANVAIDFGAKMSKVAAISGATADEFQALRKQALQLGADTKYSASESAEAMRELAAAGMATKDIMAAMPGVLNAAAASGEEVSLVAETMASTINSFGLAATDAAHIADVLAKSANISAIGVQDMAYSLKYAGPVAKQLGYSIEEVGAAIVEMGNAGIKGEQAGTTLRSAMLNLVSPVGRTADAMEALNWQAVDSQGKFKPLNTIIEELKVKFAGMTEAQKASYLSMLFGESAVSGMMVVVNGGKQKFDEYTQSLENCNGAAEEAAKIMQDNLSGALEQLGGSAESLAISLMDKVEPTLRRIVDKATEATNALTNLMNTGSTSGSNNSPADFRKIESGDMQIVSADQQVQGLGEQIGSAISGSIDKIITKIQEKFAAVNWVDLGKKVAKNAALFAIGFVSGLLDPVTWIDIIQKSWKDILMIIIGVMTLPESWAAKLATMLGRIPLVGKFLEWFVKSFNSLGSKILTPITNFLKDIGANFVTGLKKGFGDAFPDLFPTAKAAVENLVKKFDDMAFLFRLSSAKFIHQFGEGIGSLLGKIKTKGVEIANALIDGLSAGLVNFASKALDAAGNLADNVVLKMKDVLKIKSPSEVTEYFGDMVAEGFAKGIAENKDKAVNATQIMVDSINNAFSRTRQSIELDVQISTAGFDTAISKMVGDSQELARVKLEIESLGYSIDRQKDKIALAAKAYEEMAVAQGENSIEAKTLKLAWAEEEKTLAALEQQLESVKTVFDQQEQQLRDLQSAISEVEKQYREDMITALEDYQQKCRQVNEQLIADERSLRDQYRQLVKDRAESLSNFTGLFDSVENKNVSGTVLLENLKGQVGAFEKWQADIASLGKKGIDEGLLQELREMGPSAGAEIAALNTLTDSQLNEYVALWKKKNEDARNEANIQLKQQKADLEVRIMELRQTAQEQLEQYKEEWKKKNQEIKANAKKTIAEIEDSFKEIDKKAKSYGISVMDNFIDGILGQIGELRRAMQRVAKTVDDFMPQSPAEEGPLRDVMKYGPAFVKSVADGIVTSLPTLENAVSKMASLTAGSVPNSQSNNYSTKNEFGKNVININVSGGGSRDQAEEIMRELMRLGVRINA